MSTNAKINLVGILAFVALVLVSAFNSGCRRSAPEPAPATSIGARADAARADERASQSARDSHQMASLDALLARVPDMTKPGWESELGIMRARYGAAKPAPADAAEATARVNAWADGRIAEAQSLAAQALASATEHARRAAEAEAARRAAEAREVASRAESAKEIQDLKDALVAERENFSKSVRKWIVVGLYVAAVVCVGLAILRFKAALTTGLAPLAALKSGAFLLGTAGTLVTLAKLVGAWWFEYACYAVGGSILVWIGYTIWREQRLEQSARAAKVVVKQLDALYENSVKADQEALDSSLFAPLSDEMKKVPGAKAAIHLLRAT